MLNGILFDLALLVQSSSENPRPLSSVMTPFLQMDETATAQRVLQVRWLPPGRGSSLFATRGSRNVLRHLGLERRLALLRL